MVNGHDQVLSTSMRAGPACTPSWRATFADREQPAPHHRQDRLRVGRTRGRRPARWSTARLPPRGRRVKRWVPAAGLVAPIYHHPQVRRYPNGVGLIWLSARDPRDDRNGWGLRARADEHRDQRRHRLRQGPHATACCPPSADNARILTFEDAAELPTAPGDVLRLEAARPTWKQGRG